ncbi:MAG TPA: tetratricopeptide repeat protein [Clostridiales bacterium]|nr:tetratricopeptide repeat protein [Clostridiales bacterium]HQP69909.1 tetratricopeptide repeat protein [Clostridiales bacterium]
MRNLVPEKVINNLKENKYQDKYTCFSMFVDISGFTKTTEALMKHGQEGAEILSDILKYLFETTVKAVYDRGGYVTKYAGDAFTALFETGKDLEKTALKVLDAALITNRFFEDNKIYTSKFGDFEFGVKVGLAYGECICGITGSVTEKTYYFSGKAVDLCAMAEHNASKGEIWLSDSIYPFIRKHLQETKEAELYGRKFYKAVRTGKISSDAKEYEVQGFQKELIYTLTGKLEAEFPVGEFRDIISIFISFEGEGILNDLMKKLYDLKEIYGASHPVLDFGDKGGNILLFVGAPISYENNSFRALMLISKLIESFGNKLRAGLAKGIVYCGFNGSELRNEFTCLGNTVNQSARFMMKAEWGQVLTDRELSTNENFFFSHLADIEYKGRAGLIPTHILNGRAEVKDVFFKGAYIGRKKEREKLKKFLMPLEKGKNCGTIYIDGEAGIGKSRLTNQTRQDFLREYEKAHKKINWFYFSCEEIIKAPYNPFRYFFQRYFDFDENSRKENTRKFSVKYEKILIHVSDSGLKEELLIYKGYLSYFLGLEVSDPDILSEEPNERQNSIVLSLISFFKTFCEYSPLVFEVDNAVFIDSDSVKLFERIAVSLKRKPFAILFNSRYRDNGSAIDLNFRKERRISLKPLNKAEFKDLVKNRLKLKTVPSETLKVLDEKSRRNPLYLEQLVIYIQENGVLDKKNKIKDISNLPAGINQIILARVDKLKTELKDILKSASCIGNEVPIDLVSYLFRDRYANIEKNLTELENEDILILFSEISYLFKYGVIRDVVYNMQLKKTVREIHESIAEAIEDIHEASIENYYPILAYHYENAENIKKALDYHKKAGYQAKENYLNDQALHHFDRAAELLSKKNGIYESEWADKFEILDKNNVREFIKLNIERFYFYFGFIQNIQISSQLADVTYDLSSKMSDGNLLSDSLMNRSLILANKGDFEKSNSTLKQAIIVQNDLRLYYQAATSYFTMGKNNTMVGNMEESVKCFHTGLDQAQLIENEKLRKKITAKIYGAMGVVFDYSGNFSEALKYYNMQLGITEELNLKSEKAAAIGNIGVIYHITGDYTKAMEYYETKLKLIDELGIRVEMAQTLNNIGFLYKDLKNYNKAILYHKRSYNISQEVSDYNTMASAVINLGHVYKFMKNHEKSEQSYLKGIKIAEDFGYKHSYAEGMIELADLYFSQNRSDLSKEYAEKGFKAASEINFMEYIERGKEIIEKIISK